MQTKRETIAGELRAAARAIGDYRKAEHWAGFVPRLEGLLGRARRELWTGPRQTPEQLQALAALQELERAVTDKAREGLDATQCRAVGHLFEGVRHRPGSYR